MPAWTTAPWQPLRPAACSSTSCRTISFNNDFVNLVNPDRGLYGTQQTKNFYTHVDNVSLSFEDRLKLTPTFALIGGVRIEEIDLARTAFDVDGVLRSADGYPFSKSFTPVTGRVGYTWEAIPGTDLLQPVRHRGRSHGRQHLHPAPDDAVAADDVAHLRDRRQGAVLGQESRVDVLGVRYRAQERLCPRKAAYCSMSPGKLRRKGFEMAGAVSPIGGLKLWGNAAYQSRFKYGTSSTATGLSLFTGNTPPNVPRIVANAGASYRFATPLPVELGASVRHVGDRFNFDDNLVIMNAYTIADAYVFVDIPKSAFSGVHQTRVTFRVKNLTDKRYAIWGDPGLPRSDHPRRAAQL